MKKVFTTGTFDILHYGHISLLRRAKALGDYLVVGVNVNPEGKIPFYSYEERKQILSSIKYVDEVVPLYQQEDKFRYLKHVQIFACGSEYKQHYDIERIKTFAKVVFLDRTPNISTTKEKEYLRSRERYNTLCIDIDDTLCLTKK
jgi:glycerol-3-phosphate cytidylyltransferase